MVKNRQNVQNAYSAYVCSYHGTRGLLCADFGEKQAGYRARFIFYKKIPQIKRPVGLTNFRHQAGVWAGLAFQPQEWRLKRTVPAVLNRIIQGSDHRYFSLSAASAPGFPSL